jgi:hypothetical protein
MVRAIFVPAATFGQLSKHIFDHLSTVVASKTSAGINGNLRAEPFRQAQDPESVEGL